RQGGVRFVQFAEKVPHGSSLAVLQDLFVDGTEHEQDLSRSGDRLMVMLRYLCTIAWSVLRTASVAQQECSSRRHERDGVQDRLKSHTKALIPGGMRCLDLGQDRRSVAAGSQLVGFARARRRLSASGVMPR